MGKIIMFNLVTIDGFFAGADRGLEWHRVDDEFRVFAADQLDKAAGLMFGRITYQMMADYWPRQEAIANDPRISEKMNSLPKMVFSKTLSNAKWKNTLLMDGELEFEINKLKQTNFEYLIFGSADLCSSLAELGLIDEFRILIIPTILGQGIPLFKPKNKLEKLELVGTRIFHSGNVLLCYQPAHRSK